MTKTATIVYETFEFGCQRRENGELIDWSAGGGDKSTSFSFETNDKITDKVAATKLFLKDKLYMGYGNTVLFSFKIKSVTIH